MDKINKGILSAKHHLESKHSYLSEKEQNEILCSAIHEELMRQLKREVNELLHGMGTFHLANALEVLRTQPEKRKESSMASDLPSDISPITDMPGKQLQSARAKRKKVSKRK